MINLMSYIDKFTSVMKGVELTRKGDDENLEVSFWMKDVLRYLQRVKKNGNNIYIIGNGASSSMASHFATDFTKNAGIGSYSNNDGALLTCFGNDYSFDDSYMQMLKNLMKDGDLLIAISSSGQSKNIINAVRYLKNTVTITLSAFKPDNPLRNSGDCNLYLPTDEYGLAESGHAYYLHLILDLFIKFEESKWTNIE